MAQNHVRPGNTMTWTNNTGADVRSGDPVRVGTRLCIALGDIAAGATGELATCEVWTIRKAAVDIAQGEIVYWDVNGDPVNGVAGSGCITNEATGAVDLVDNDVVGRCFASAAAADETVQVQLGVV